jgi:myosin-5
VITEGQIARHYYEDLRRKAASLKIQTCYRMHFARKHYKDLCSASTTVQSGLRGMATRSELHSRQQTKAAVIIQVRFQLSFFVCIKCGVTRFAE